MNHTSLNPTRCEWVVNDAAQPGARITLRGWDFGGSGRTILLHHANGFCSGTWALVAEYLVQDFHVVALDARGHGDSDTRTAPQGYAWSYFVDDLVQVATAVLQQTGERTLAAGVGSSFGGIITAGASAQTTGQEKLFDVVVMLDPPIHPRPEILEALGMAGSREDNPGDRQDQLVTQTLKRRTQWDSRQAVRESWQGKPMFADWLPQGFDLYLDQAFRDLPNGGVELKCHPTVEAHIFGTTGSYSPLEFAPKVHVPLLLARATKSFGLEAFFQKLVTLFPQGQYAELDGGHLLPLEVPELCAQAVQEFIATAG